jgi:pantoate--beta-alanine ligase
MYPRENVCLPPFIVRNAMQVYSEIAALQAFLASSRTNNNAVGLVPTMGALHQGHLSLIAKSVEENRVTVCSIFVNPTQFNNPGDLEKYPRTPEQDLKLLEKSGCQAVFMPDSSILYPTQPKTSFTFGKLEEVMEGPNRPGHFSGVALVVSKLFNIVQPTNAYFGQKDWQQCCIINQLVTDLNFPIKLHFVLTSRSESGLALSSRNRRLSEPGLNIAANLYKSLQVVAQALISGATPAQALSKGKEFLTSYPEIEVEYLAIADSRSLQPLLPGQEAKEAVICLAAWLEGVRLIDNLLLENFAN